MELDLFIYFFFQQKLCIGVAVICHHRAGDDACKHLKCIKITGKCLHKAGVRLHHLPPAMVSTVLHHHSILLPVPRATYVFVETQWLTSRVISLDKKLYLTLFLFTQVYKWVPAIIMLGGNLAMD